MDNYFNTLNRINVSDKTEMKGNLTYLSWAWAWGEVKKHFPDATYTVYENEKGWNYHTDGKTCWVKTGVTVNGIEHIEYLPVMDNRNNPIPLERVNSFDVNKAIQRSVTKAISRHGLGLYIYAGEDLPEDDKAEAAAAEAEKRAAEAAAYDAAVNAAKEILAAVTDAATANQAMPVFQGISHAGDSRNDCNRLWNQHMKKLNLFYDRVLKQYTTQG